MKKPTTTGQVPVLSALRQSDWLFDYRYRLLFYILIIGDFFHHTIIGTISKVHIQTPCVQPNPPLFPDLGKEGCSGGYALSRRQKIEQPVQSVKGKPPQSGGADAPLTDSPRLF